MDRIGIVRIRRNGLPLQLAAVIGLFLASLSFSGCAPATQKPQREVSETAVARKFSDLYMVDFRPFVERGFLISPWRTEGDYDIVADVRAEYHPSTELVVTTESTPTRSSPFYTDTSKANATVVDVRWRHMASWDLQEAMENVYQRCLALGADGLIEFRVSTEHAAAHRALLRSSDSQAAHQDFERATAAFRQPLGGRSVDRVRSDLLSEEYDIIVISGYAIRRNSGD